MGGVSALSRAVLHQPGRLWGSYMKTLNRKPVQTKVATSMAAALLGDAIAQHMSCPASGIDWE